MNKSKFARRARSVAVGLLAGLLVVFIYIAFLQRTTPQPEIAIAPPPVAAPHFSLVDQNGDTFTNAYLEGKVWLAELTNGLCPEPCSRRTGRLADVRDKLYAQGLLGTHVVLVSFSGHPQVDSPEVMKRLAEAYDAEAADWRFLTGPHDYLDEYVGANFFLPVDIQPHETFGTDGPPPYALVRSNRFVLVDKQGRVRNYFNADRLHIEREMNFLFEEIEELLLEG